MGRHSIHVAMCHTYGMPCVTHVACYVSHKNAFAMHCDTDTWLAMCCPTLVASKYVKFRLSRNSTKFDWVARFLETIPMV